MVNGQFRRHNNRESLHGPPHRNNNKACISPVWGPMDKAMGIA